jgi:hypothetical protein
VGDGVGVTPGVGVGVGVAPTCPNVRLGEITHPVESKSMNATAQSHTGIKLRLLNIWSIYCAIITQFLRILMSD